ncbi:PfkB family carbohydrate kinase, partial [Desulfosarcina sp.]|uniref:PfkB family carbohydrate kinase n=1 Tax=Desulfosarcina sp. TaxID=2027861 RepID=UPI0029B964A6
GRRIIDMLEKNGFNEADIQIDYRHPTGTVRVDLDARGIPHFDIRTDVAYDHLNLNLTDILDTGGADMIYFGSLLQRTDSSRSQVQRFLSRNTNSATRFCDINMRPPHVNGNAVAESLHHADLLKVNEEELAEIQRAFDGPTDRGGVMPWLMETFKISAVALTRGSRGSTFYNRDGQISSPAVAGPPIVDTVGAGDGYAAILAAGRLRKLPWEETIRQASRFAAQICGIAGAVPDNESFYDDFQLHMKGDANGR